VAYIGLVYSGPILDEQLHKLDMTLSSSLPQRGAVQKLEGPRENQAMKYDKAERRGKVRKVGQSPPSRAQSKGDK
jgi:hypothetical protein